MRRSLYRRKRPIDYILPFLVLVSLGVIGILGFQVWSTWDQQGKADVYFYVAEGKAKLLPYGQPNWDPAFSGTKMLLGDSLKTSLLGRVVMEFFNDTKIRLGPDTAVTLSDVHKGGDRETIALNLENGSVWVNGHKSVGVRDAVYEVRTAHLLVKAQGTVFEVESSDVEEVVRVFDGDIEVDVIVLSNGQERVAETLNVGVGQEIMVDQAALNAFEKGNSPSVLKALSDSFKRTSWYMWNIQEDNNPTDFSLVGNTFSDSSLDEDAETDTSLEDDGSSESLEDDISAEEDDTMEPDEINDEFSDESSEVKAPVITAPTDTVVTEKSFVITGTVESNVAKVVVESVLGPYTLAKFALGDTEWTYNVSESIGNLEPGENTYTVYAYDEDDNKSDPAILTVTYEKEEVVIEDDLEDPQVLSFNGVEVSDFGVARFEGSVDAVTVVGSVRGAETVVVNGYTLTQFEPGATSWQYAAKESLGNLQPGENSYEVYAVDPDGNKTEVVEFVIVYNKEESTDEPPSEDEDVTDEGSKGDESDGSVEEDPDQEDATEEEDDDESSEDSGSDEASP